MANNYAPELPDDVLHVIVRKLSSMVCHAAFRSVCRSWRSFSLQYYSYLVPPQPPWLMFPASLDPPSRTFNLYTFDGRTQFFQFEVPKEYIFGWCSGTWLIFYDTKEFKIRVWNPLSSIHILLPPEPETLILQCHKFIVSCPGPLMKEKSDMVFGVFYSYQKLVAFIRLGDEAWTNVEIDLLPEPKINDILFYQSKLYAVDQSGMIFVCEEDVHAPHYDDHHRRRTANAIMLINDEIHQHINVHEANNTRYYLVEVNGDLMLVFKYYLMTSKGHPSRKCYESFKVDFSKGKLERLGFQDYSVFLSSNDACMSTIIPEITCMCIKTLRKPSLERRLKCKFTAIGHFKGRKTSSVPFRVNNWKGTAPRPAWIIPRHGKPVEKRASLVEVHRWWR